MAPARAAAHALLVIAVAIAAAAPAFAQSSCTKVNLFEQCGGRSSEAGINGPDPRYCCASGLCKRFNDFFWQCQPSGYNAPPAPVETYDASCSAKTKVPFWSGCGGISSYGQNASNPSVCCPSGTTCSHYSDFFWQCQPAGYKPKTVVGTWSTCQADSRPVQLWAQCGGQGFTQSVCCPDESVCNVYNPFFSQCQPVGYTAPPQPTPEYASTCAANSTKVPLWTGACGGTNSSYGQNGTDPNSCCPVGSTCTFYDPTYWRCVPSYYTGPTANPVQPATVTVTLTYTLPVPCSQIDTSAWSNTVDASLSNNTAADVSVSTTCKDITARRRGRRALLQSSSSSQVTSTVTVVGSDATTVNAVATTSTALVNDGSFKLKLATNAIPGGNAAQIAAQMQGSAAINGQPAPSPSPEQATSPSPSPAASPSPPIYDSPSPSPSPPVYNGRRRLSENMDDAGLGGEDDTTAAWLHAFDE